MLGWTVLVKRYIDKTRKRLLDVFRPPFFIFCNSVLLTTRFVLGAITGLFDSILWSIGKTRKTLRPVTTPAHKLYKKVHARTLDRLHLHLLNRWGWYGRWHRHPHHRKAHYATLSTYCLILAVYALGVVGHVLALGTTWDFSVPANYSTSSLAEAASNTGRLKVNEYTNDANTAALYHLNNSSGTSITDSSSNANTGTATGATWGPGKLNNAMTFDGSTSNINTPSSSSLNLTGADSLEAWTKFGSAWSANSSENRQPIIDKGNYKLYYDQQTGKINYELAQTGQTNWTQQAGPIAGAGNQSKNSSWDTDLSTTWGSTWLGSNYYVALGANGSSLGQAEVWKWNGTVWSKIGGDGVNGSWADGIYSAATSITNNGTYIYAGLGPNVAGQAEVWRYDPSGNTWTKVADKNTTNWSGYEVVWSLVANGSTIYAGMGDSGGADADVWKCTSCDTTPSWSQIGGDGLNSGWAAGSFTRVKSLDFIGSTLIAGLGQVANGAEVWKYNGVSWSQLANTATTFGNHTQVWTITHDGNILYVGLGSAAAGDGDLWKCSDYTTCTTASGWTQIGGDGLNSGWPVTTIETVRSLVVDGSSNLYAGLGDTANSSDDSVWKWNGASWSQIGGNGVNSSWSNNSLQTWVNTLSINGSTLYAAPGLTGTTGTTEIWQTSTSSISWSMIGGHYANGSWGGTNVTDVASEATANGKLYAGLDGGTVGEGTVWELNGSTWKLIGAPGYNSAWGINANAPTAISSMISYGGNLYVGTYGTTSTSAVWKWNGSSWTQIAGGGLNSSWNATYQGVLSMAVYGGDLYVGTGDATSSYGTVWKYHSGSWTQVGGGGLNSGWNLTNVRGIYSLTVFNGNLYAGTGINATTVNLGLLWQWNGASWTEVGGNGTGSSGQSWNANNTAGGSSTYRLRSLAVYNNKLYAGLDGANTEVWQCSAGCTSTTGWTKVAGAGLNSSWADGTYTNNSAFAMAVYNGELYLAVTNNSAANTGSIWKYDGSSWTQVGANGQSGWPANLETVHSLAAYSGKLWAGTGDTRLADDMILSYGNNVVLTSTTATQDTSWHQIAATYDGNTMKIFIDGVLDNSLVVGAVAVPTNSQPLLIGASFGSATAGAPQAFFNGSMDEVRISNTARGSPVFHTYSTGSETIQPTAAVYTSGIASWAGFADSETANGGTITYRLSSDGGTTWKYWSGSAWSTSSGTSQANAVATINSNVGTFPVTNGGFLWQAVLTGNGEQLVTLNSVTLTITADNTAPNNPSVSGQDSALGTNTLSDNNWYNFAAPYFTWSAPSDPPGPGEGSSGINGYYVYFGTDNTANPVTAGTFQTATNYTVSSLLVTNTSYYLRIATKDNGGNTAAGATVFTYKYDATPPAVVDHINVSPVGCSTASTFTFTWPTATDDESGFAGYQYRFGSEGNIHDLGASALTITGSPYQVGDNVFYLRSKDNAGNLSAWQTGIYCSTNATSIIDGPTVVAGPSSITVNWTSSKETTSFVLVNQGNNYVSEQGQSVYTITHTVKVVGLQPEQSYSYKLDWVDSSGNPGASDFFTTTTSNAPTIGDLTAKPLSTSTALISWNTSVLSSVILKYGIDGFTSTLDLSGQATSFTQQLTELKAGSSYQVRVDALTPDGFPYYGLVTLTTPPAPFISNFGFNYKAGSQATVDVHWTTNVPTTSIVTYRSKATGVSLTQSSAELTTDHLIEITGLSDNADYTFQAFGMDNFGNQTGSDIQNYSTPFDTRPPAITNINAESSIRGTGAEAGGQIVVSWQTDEPSTSQVMYSQGSNPAHYDSLTAEDSSLTSQHIVIISNLPTSHIFSIKPVSKDHAGNKSVGSRQTVIIRHPSDSVLTLILNTLQKIFGF